MPVRNYSFIGLTLNGGFGDYCLVDARATASIPDKMSFVQAAPLMCAGITIYKAIRRAEQAGLQPGGVSSQTACLFE